MTAEIRRARADEEIIQKEIVDGLGPALRKAWDDELSKSELWIGLWDGELALLLGFTSGSLVSQRAYVWSWTTPVVLRCRKTFLKLSREMLDYYFDTYAELYGYCLGESVWLKHLGAKISDGSFILRRS